MAKAKKITKKELESIKDVQQKTNAILLDVGYLEAQKTGLIAAHAEATKGLQVIKTELEEKYNNLTNSTK